MKSRAEEIVAALTLEEKIALVSGRDMWRLEPVSSAGVPSVLLADGPHGLRKQIGSSDAVGLFESTPATCFPPAVTLASTWDPSLAEEVGKAVGLEARAQGVGVVLGPGLNLKRHPCCGRNFEYFSEDPLLSGRMAAAIVRGIQTTGVGACAKHFVANNQETRRMTVDAIVDERTLRELYLAGFEVVVREAAPRAIMCAYNRVNGEYCSDSRRLLTGILRGEWGFDGLVMSDWGATNDRVAGLESGMDLEMPSSGSANDEEIRDALAEGRLSENALDLAASRVVAFGLAVAQADVPGSERYGAEIDPDAHHALARCVAAEGAVLLTNNGVLPLERPGRIAVLGAFAAEPRYQGAGSSLVAPTRLDTALAALRDRLADPGEVRFEPGYDVLTGDADPAQLDAAREAAAAADTVLVFAGLPGAFESEGVDREHMRMPDGHLALIETACDANARTVVVLSNGAPVEMGWAARPAAVLEGYLGGQAGGSAIADVLFGDAEPGGRLAETFPIALTDVPADDNFPGTPADTPAQVHYREALNVGYRYFASAQASVAFPFGHGLSYATFEFDPPTLSNVRFDADTEGSTLEVRIRLHNTGERPGSEVVQVYVRPVAPQVMRPRLELGGFAKLRIEPGESAEAVVHLDRRAFAFYDVRTARWQVEPGEYEIVIGASVTDIRGVAGVTVDSGCRPGQVAPQPVRVADHEAFEALVGRAIPAAPSLRPFTRTSAVADLDATRLGRLVRRALVFSARRRSTGGLAGEDDVVAAMMERVVDELPLRNLVGMSAGQVSWRKLDALIDALNGEWSAAVRRLVRGRG